MYTKQNAKENREIDTMAKDLLVRGIDVICVLTELRLKFPEVARYRIASRVVKAQHILRGEEIRGRTER